MTTTMRLILIAAAMSMTWPGAASAADPVYVFPSTSWSDRAVLLMVSDAARYFRADCRHWPRSAEFATRLARAEKFIDELGAAADPSHNLKQVRQANAMSLEFMGGADYCKHISKDIDLFGRLQ